MILSETTIEKSTRLQLFNLDERRFRMRAFRFFLCLEILFLGFPYLGYKDSFLDLSRLELHGLVFVLLFFLVLPFLIFRHSSVQARIVFQGGCFEFPRYFFWIRKVAAETISSLEEMKFRSKEFAVLIGFRNGGIMHFEISDFEQEEDYWRFKENVKKMLEINKISLVAKTLQIKSINWAQNLALALILSLYIVVYFLLNSSQGLDFYNSLGLGALNKNILSGEQFYRVASSFFLHLNNFHLALNIVSLALFGQFLLRVVDHYRFLSILLLSALFASLVTITFSPYEAVIGASGGIMGVFGAYCCLKLLRYLPGSISSSSNIWILFFIAVQVALEFFVEGIDSYTHAGGFITGFVYMAICIKYERDRSVFQSSTFEKFTASVLTVCYLSGLLLFFAKVNAGG